MITVGTDIIKYHINAAKCDISYHLIDQVFSSVCSRDLGVIPSDYDLKIWQVLPILEQKIQ